MARLSSASWEVAASPHFLKKDSFLVLRGSDSEQILLLGVGAVVAQELRGTNTTLFQQSVTEDATHLHVGLYILCSIYLYDTPQHPNSAETSPKTKQAEAQSGGKRLVPISRP